MTRAYVNKPPAEDTDHNNVPEDAARIEFANRLQRHMVRKGWNQSELARQATLQLPQDGDEENKNLGRSNISVYLRAKAFPRPIFLEAIAKALGVTIEDLVPTRGVARASDSAPPLDVRELGDGNAWLKVNQKVPWSKAIEIMRILKEEP